MSRVRISVVIPAWNAEPFIARTLDGILAQTYPVEEIIVSDDASTDGTKAVVQEYVSKHGERVKYIWHEHAGCGGSRNIAIRHAQCEWIALHDADDIWLPHRIASQVRVLQANPQLKWCGANYDVIWLNQDGGTARVSTQRWPAELEAHLRADRPVDFFATGMDLSYYPSAMLMHRSIFDQLGLFDESLPLMEDRDMWWRVALRYPLIGYPPEVCCHYHKNVPGAMTDFNVRGPGRDVEATILLRHLQTATEIGGQVEEAYRAFGKRLMYDYLFREAGGQATIRPDLVKGLRNGFGLTTKERLVLAAVKALPRRLAYRVVNRYRL